MKALVNGKEVEISHLYESYFSIIAIAGFDIGHSPSISWIDKDGNQGTLWPGERILMDDGIVFGVVPREL